jgi:hypothetical protein
MHSSASMMTRDHANTTTWRNIPIQQRLLNWIPVQEPSTRLTKYPPLVELLYHRIYGHPCRPAFSPQLIIPSKSPSKQVNKRTRNGTYSSWYKAVWGRNKGLENLWRLGSLYLYDTKASQFLWRSAIHVTLSLKNERCHRSLSMSYFSGLILDNNVVDAFWTIVGVIVVTVRKPLLDESLLCLLFSK